MSPRIPDPKVLPGPPETPPDPPSRFRVLTLSKAAEFLQAHPDWVRKEAKAGRLPGRKMGRLWKFIEEDLVVWLRSGYKDPRQAPLVEVSKWQYSKEAIHGGLISLPRAETELDALLKRKTGRKPRNSTTT